MAIFSYVANVQQNQFEVTFVVLLLYITSMKRSSLDKIVFKPI